MAARAAQAQRHRRRAADLMDHLANNTDDHDRSTTSSSYAMPSASNRTRAPPATTRCSRPTAHGRRNEVDARTAPRPALVDGGRRGPVESAAACARSPVVLATPTRRARCLAAIGAAPPYSGSMAVWRCVRSQMRSRWVALLALALLIGVATGVVLTTAAGARRTDSAYPRLLRDTNGADLLVSGSQDFYPRAGAPSRASRGRPPSSGWVLPQPTT